MHLIDWLIMTLPLIVCGIIAIYTRRYARSVADFMAGGRNAGRFLICTARSEQGSGAVVYVAGFQVFLVSGFALGWWWQITIPVSLLISITGFVVYRYRQTRAMTLGQFFEMRYSRKFRLFAGMLGFFAGLVNFGVIPVIGAQFMVYFLNFPLSVQIMGLSIPTYLLMMALFLTLCVIMTTTGGQVSVLLTDCAEGMFSQIFYVFIAVTLLLVSFKWSETRAVLLDSQSGKSMVNPFDTSNIQDFNIWYVVTGVILGTYRTMAWQNSHAFNSSAASAHESRMGGILGRWRWFANGLMVTLLCVCAMTYVKSPSGSVAVEAALSHVSDPATRDQMRAPVALTQMLPMGVKGALLSICLMGIIAGDGIHLHSWGSIFIQDVVMPMRRKPLSPKQHILLLRLSIIGVAVWAFLFGAVFPQTKYVQLWWSVTEAIFVSGAGIAIIGGLYWSRGTTAATWAAVILGSTLAVGGIGVQTYYERVLGRDFYLNGQMIAFVATMSAVVCYTIVSLLTCRVPHNMDKLLHRGAHAIEGESPEAAREPGKRVSWLYRILTLGVDEQFSRSDRWITVSMTVWSMIWFGIFAVGTCAYLLHPWSDGVWTSYWLFTCIYLPLVIAVVTTIWFTWGCWHDMRIFFRRLKEERVDARDDGTVQHEDEAVAATQGGRELSVATTTSE